MDEISAQHLQRLRMATVGRLGRKDLPEWIEKNTFINNRPFSFEGHDYQKVILLDDSPELVIRKSAQTGISEMAMRMALGLIMIMPGAFRIGYTMPSAGFAAGYMRTRLDPIIRSSPALRAAMSPADADNSEMKTFGAGKELYLKGSAVGNAAISTSLSMLFHDELSFSDQEVIGDYWSRVLHSEYKWRVSLSTPTYLSDPIDTAFQNSRRHWNFCKCEHCGHQFIPDYYKNVFIPGWKKELSEITKSNIHTVRYTEAEFRCPKCDKPTSLMPEHRSWVCENPTERHVAAGYQVQPFDAPTIVKLPDLVQASTKYVNQSKFKQFSLGLPATDSESGVTEEEAEALGVDLVQTPFTTHVLGIDVGAYSHFMVGGVTQDGTLVVVHYERVALKNFRERYKVICDEFRVTVKVCDIQPFTELVMSLSASDFRLFGARFVTRQSIEVYDVKQEEPDRESAIEGVKEVSVNRNALFDRMLSEMRPAEGMEPKIRIRRMGDWQLVTTHLVSMRRAQATLRDGEFKSVWQKPSDGNDHYFFALGYLWIAAQMRGFSFSGGFAALPGVSTFKLKPPKK